MGFVFNTYAINGRTSGVLPSAVARLHWAIPTPLIKKIIDQPFCRYWSEMIREKFKLVHNVQTSYTEVCVCMKTNWGLFFFLFLFFLLVTFENDLDLFEFYHFENFLGKSERVFSCPGRQKPTLCNCLHEAPYMYKHDFRQLKFATLRKYTVQDSGFPKYDGEF